MSNIQFNFKGDLKLEKLKSKNQFNKNSIIQGDVISISDDFVGIDVGYKSIAMIPKEQFVDRDGSLNTEMGKRIPCFWRICPRGCLGVSRCFKKSTQRLSTRRL